MIRRLLVAGLTLALVACASSSPDAALNDSDPREKDPTFRYGNNPGPSPVGAIPDIVLNDPARNRSVKVSIDYPTRTGPHPLIVFSHGGGGSNRGYPGLSSHWASYGYVVIRPAHNDTATSEQMTATEWRNRAQDISFVIDSLETLAKQYPELQGKVDPTRIAVAGHARGATTAMMIGGLRTFPGPVSYADKRVKAIAAFSPNGPRESWGVTNESWAELRVPALFMTGTRDNGVNENETPTWREQAFELSPAGDKWLVVIENVTAGTFTGQANPPSEIGNRGTVPMGPSRDPAAAQRESERQRIERARMSGMSQRVLFGSIRALALAFFDAYLKEDPKGREYLVQTDERPSVEVKRK